MVRSSMPALVTLLACCLGSLSGGPLEAATATPPGQPSTGYGSSQAYISTSYQVSELGNARDGSRIWTYLPSTLKGGTQAPVVIFLHGWTAYLPNYYIGMIEHLSRQGYIVLYPQYQKSGVVGLLTDSDQTLFLSRAVKAVDQAVQALGSKADTRQVFVTGHSLGGLLGYCWNSASSLKARQLMLMNAALDSSSGVPDAVGLIEIDWKACAPEITVPLTFLTGAEDPLNPQSLWGAEAAVNAPFRAVYMANTDPYGDPDIVADHVAPLTDKSAMTLDYRFYMAAMDAMTHGDLALTFDFGTWSDGVRVTAPDQVYP